MRSVGRKVDGDAPTLEIARMNDALAAWVSAWAKDSARPHRSVTIKRGDGRAVRVVALVALVAPRGKRAELRVEKVASVR